MILQEPELEAQSREQLLGDVKLLRKTLRYGRKIAYMLLRASLQFECRKAGIFSLRDLVNEGCKTIDQTGLFAEALR